LEIDLQIAQYEVIISDILENGYAVFDNFLNLTEIDSLLETFRVRFDKNQFSNAGIGKNDDLQQNKLIRGDEILWLQTDTIELSEIALLSKNQLFIDYLNKTCYLGITGSEIHFAKYGKGKFYRRHRDAFQSKNGRVLSIIYYLNKSWVEKDGGNLLIFTNKNNVETTITINPIAGRMVCFESDKLDHEVLETFVDRLSVTGWFLK
jgi:SM-20-related protein